MSERNQNGELQSVGETAAKAGGGVLPAMEKGAVKGYKAVENGVVSGYKAVENAVVGAYTKIEDKFVDRFLAKDGESAEEAKQRLRAGHGEGTDTKSR